MHRAIAGCFCTSTGIDDNCTNKKAWKSQFYFSKQSKHAMSQSMGDVKVTNQNRTFRKIRHETLNIIKIGAAHNHKAVKIESSALSLVSAQSLLALSSTSLDLDVCGSSV